ncbi:MAG: hypothetical protein LC808_06635, partial [Actinobacteria bacterium]|nr:hypothetical protein [Actinomycetota bacterium]
EITDSDLVVTPRGFNKVWALKRRVSIPLTSITSAKVITTRTRDLPLGIRLPGSAIPGLVLAGTYLKNGERSFYALRDGKDIVLLELTEHRYARVGVQTKNPYDVVNRINSHIDARR